MRKNPINPRAPQFCLSVIAVVAVLGSAALFTVATGGPALAQTSGGHEEGGHEGGGGQGQGGQGGGHEEGGHEEGGHEGGGGQGQGGHSEGGDAGSTGGGGEGQGGGGEGSGTRPVWAGEGIPEVELGRLNVVRSPEHVLQRALEEALATLSPEMLSFYGLTLDEMMDQLANNWGSVSFIDSPLQNLAMMEALLSGEVSPAQMGVSNDPMTLAAMMLGAASDKNIEISQNTVIAVTAIMGLELTEAEIAALAAAAEEVRQAILTGHG